MFALHNASALIWISMIVIHALAYLRRLPTVVACQPPKGGQ